MEECRIVETPPPLRFSDRLEPEDHFTAEEEVPREAPAKNVKYKEREARYVIVSSPGSIRRLQQSGATLITSRMSSLLRKFMTSKFPSTLVLMELVEELSFRHCALKLYSG